MKTAIERVASLLTKAEYDVVTQDLTHKELYEKDKGAHITPFESVYDEASQYVDNIVLVTLVGSTMHITGAATYLEEHTEDLLNAGTTYLRQVRYEKYPEAQSVYIGRIELALRSYRKH